MTLLPRAIVLTASLALFGQGCLSVPPSTDRARPSQSSTDATVDALIYDADSADVAETIADTEPDEFNDDATELDLYLQTVDEYQ